MNLYVTVLLFTLEILVVYAYPYGAGTCAAGKSSPLRLIWMTELYVMDI